MHWHSEFPLESSVKLVTVRVVDMSVKACEVTVAPTRKVSLRRFHSLALQHPTKLDEGKVTSNILCH